MISYVVLLDSNILDALYAMRDANLVQILIWVSELGRTPIVYGLAIVVILALVLYRHYAYAAGLAISVAAGGIGILIFKGLVERARPPVDFQAYIETWHSFPSAHAALSMALYGFLAYLAFRLVEGRLARFALLCTSALIVAAVSFSRIYLGVHYASDVAAGLILGSASAWLGILFVKRARI